MSSRGFLLLELLIAFALFLLLAIALFSLSATLPRSVSSGQLRSGGIARVEHLLLRAAKHADRDFSSLATTSTVNDGPYVLGTSASEAEDDGFIEIGAHVSWKNAFGSEKSFTVEQRLANSSSTPSLCDPFVSGNWTQPVLTDRYLLSMSGILASATSSQYSLGALAVTPSLLITAMASTSTRTAPSLFFFSAHGRDQPRLIGGFDNASSSRIGFSSLALSTTTLFAGNAFGSASAATCSDGASCAQVLTYSIANAVPQFIGKLSLSTTLPPRAQTVSGATAGARTLTYKDGYLYVGLEKTSGGYEFNIVDARDPAHLVWRSGLPVGNSVTSITVRGTIAYVATDDSQRELMLIDISNPFEPRLLSSWNALGANGFGYGAASTVRTGYVRFVRTYSPNGKEMQLVDARDPHNLLLVEEYDRGTSLDPQSAQDLLTQDWLSFLLLTRRLELWNTGALRSMSPYGAPHALPSGARGVALACRNERIYLGYTLASGESAIDVLTGSRP